MKTNFLLALLVLNGLLFGAKSASAFTESSSQNSQQIADLSQSISRSIDLDRDDRNLLESAIHRALLAKEDRRPQPTEQPQIAGGISAPKSETSIINGKVAQPQTQPSDKKLINGMMISPPSQTEPQITPIQSDRR